MALGFGALCLAFAIARTAQLLQHMLFRLASISIHQLVERSLKQPTLPRYCLCPNCFCKLGEVITLLSGSVVAVRYTKVFLLVGWGAASAPFHLEPGGGMAAAALDSSMEFITHLSSLGILPGAPFH